MAGQVMEPRKRRSQGSRHVRRAWKATVSGPHEASEARTLPSGSESLAREHMPSAREPGDLMGAKAQQQGVWPQREGTCRNPKMHAHEESDTLVLPKKSANSRVTPEESTEGRGVTRGKPAPRNAPGTQRPIQRAHVTERVGQRAKEEKGVRFNNLFGQIPLRYSTRDVLPVGAGCASHAGGTRPTAGEVRAHTAPRENARDSLRAFRPEELRAGWASAAGDIRLPGLHPYIG
jgi:hypothetical protein